MYATPAQQWCVMPQQLERRRQKKLRSVLLNIQRDFGYLPRAKCSIPLHDVFLQYTLESCVLLSLQAKGGINLDKNNIDAPIAKPSSVKAAPCLFLRLILSLAPIMYSTKLIVCHARVRLQLSFSPLYHLHNQTDQRILLTSSLRHPMLLTT